MRERYTPYVPDDGSLDHIADTAALSLGRPGGGKMSDEERYLLSTVQQAFDTGVLNSLSPMQRKCFTDVIISGDSQRDVALRYHISQSAVRTYISQAAQHIREAINHE